MNKKFTTEEVKVLLKQGAIVRKNSWKDYLYENDIIHYKFTMKYDSTYNLVEIYYFNRPYEAYNFEYYFSRCDSNVKWELVK